MKIVYIILNGELKMSPGKAAAQAVHASMLLGSMPADSFTEEYKRSVIVLEAKNTQQMENFLDYLDNAGIEASHYIDEGVKEVEPYSLTAIAAGPIDSDDMTTREIFRRFPLFSKKGKMRWLGL